MPPLPPPRRPPLPAPAPPGRRRRRRLRPGAPAAVAAAVAALSALVACPSLSRGAAAFAPAPAWRRAAAVPAPSRASARLLPSLLPPLRVAGTEEAGAGTEEATPPAGPRTEEPDPDPDPDPDPEPEPEHLDAVGAQPLQATPPPQLQMRDLPQDGRDLEHKSKEEEEEAGGMRQLLPMLPETVWERLPEGMDRWAFPPKVINAAILTLSFGFVLYTVINVDSEITRGWTQSEIAMRIPLDTWSSYESSLSSKPIETKTLINVVIYLLGDWLSQTAFQGKDVLDFDAGRTLRNGFIGLCFGPLVHQYYEFSDSILPVDGPAVNRLYKIFMDQTLYLFVKCSVYIVAVGTLGGEGFRPSVDNARDRIGTVMVTAWKFWPLVHCVTYGVIPARHRILWVNSVDLVWNAILASKASGEGEEEDGGEDGKGAEAEAQRTAPFFLDPMTAEGGISPPAANGTEAAMVE